MLRASKRKFGEILVAEGILDREQVELALAARTDNDGPIGEYLVQTGKISESDVARVLCVQFALPFIRPAGYEHRSDLLEKFQARFLYRHRILPLDRIGSACIVAIAGVPPEEVQQELADALDAQVYFFFATSSDIETILREHLKLSREDVLEIDSIRRPSVAVRRPPRAAGAQGAGSTPAAAPGLFEGLDSSSWESIFDQAERNVAGDRS